MTTKYRIVTNKFGEYSAQAKSWWPPFWLKLADDKGYLNSFETISECELLIESHKKDRGFRPEVVKSDI